MGYKLHAGILYKLNVTSQSSIKSEVLLYNTVYINKVHTLKVIYTHTGGWQMAHKIITNYNMLRIFSVLSKLIPAVYYMYYSGW